MGDSSSIDKASWKCQSAFLNPAGNVKQLSTAIREIWTKICASLEDSEK
jgi:hypothetical protein